MKIYFRHKQKKLNLFFDWQMYAIIRVPLIMFYSIMKQN